MNCDAEFHLVEVILHQIHHMTWLMTVVWLDYILAFTFSHWAILYRCFAIMCFWGIATNWRGVSDEEKWRYEKWEREWIIWTSRASPQELMYTICLLALIYAQSLQHWSISRSTARHVCMAPRSKPYSSAPFPWKPYENGRTCNFSRCKHPLMRWASPTLISAQAWFEAVLSDFSHIKCLDFLTNVSWNHTFLCDNPILYEKKVSGKLCFLYYILLYIADSWVTLFYTWISVVKHNCLNTTATTL